MHSKRASARKKVRGRKGVAPEMKPAEREDKGQGRGSAEESRVDGSRTSVSGEPQQMSLQK